MSKELVDYDGYEPDEMRSLARWMLRSGEFVNTFLPDEMDQFYWMDRLKSNMTKNPYLFLKSIVEDHATAPNSLIERVLDVIEESKWLRDQYQAVHLMTEFSLLPVDRNVSRAHDLAVRDDALDTLDHKVDWEEGTKGDSVKLMEAQDEFSQTCALSNQPIPEEKARELIKLALRVQQLSPKYEKRYLEHLLSDLRRYVDRIDADDDLKKRMLLITRAFDCPIANWRKKDLMMVLWAVYSLMEVEVATLPEPHATMLEDMMHKTLKSRDAKIRLPMPMFAVDVTTKRGRNGSDTSNRLFNKKMLKLVGPKSEVRKKYNPIDASHGPSPHDTLQTMADFKTMVTECERLQSSSLVPKLFEIPQDEEGTVERGEDEEQVVKRLKRDVWRVVMQVAESDVADETFMDTLPRTTSRSVMLDFEKGVSYEGPLNPTVALGALSVSRLGTKVANLESVPRVRLLLNATKSKIYLEKTLFGDRPKDTDTDTDLEEEEEENCQVTLSQRSLHRATNAGMIHTWWRKCSLEMIKMFIFRRLVGMSCSPVKCLIHAHTGKIQMADLYSLPKDYKRCQTTVRKESADWLFDSSSHRKIIKLVSKALTEDKDCITEVISWLSTIVDHQAFKTATASILEPYAIPFEDFKENVRAVMSAYGVVPETDDEEEE